MATSLAQLTEAHFRAMLDHAPIGVFLTDASGTNLYLNERHHRLLGLTREGALGAGWQRAIHPDERAAAVATYERLARERAPGHVGIIRFMHAGGAVVHAQVRLVALRDGERLEGYVGFSEDITERLKSEQALRQKQRVEAVGRLAGGIAHDFNNLLTVILASAALAEMETAPASPAREPLADISSAAKRAASLTRQLLAFARRQAVEPRVLDLNELVLNLDKMLRRLIGEDVELVTLPAPMPEPVLADPGQLEQVLINLTVNARDAMPEGGTLTLETAHTVFPEGSPPAPDLAAGVYVALRVRDSGRGMSPEVLAQCFEPFYSTKPPGEGTGLGLATVQGIVSEARGHVTLASQPGHGTTVTVLLPRAAAALTHPAGAAEELPRGTEVVLVVEDEATLRGVAGRILRAYGYEVLVASDGGEGLRVAEARPDIALVLTDVVMPQMGGIEMVHALRRARPDLRVLFTSGYVETPSFDAVVRERGSAFLAKPYLPAELLKRVRERLDLPA